MENTLKVYRKLLGLELKDIAAITETTVSAVSNVEISNKKNVRVDNAQKYVDAITDLSCEKSNGEQCLLIGISDLFIY